MSVTVFLRFAGLAPFFGLAAKDGITLTLRILSSPPTKNTVKASKMSNVCTSKEVCSSSSSNTNVDQIVISSEDDFATFRVNIAEPVEMLELNMKSALVPERRVFIPVSLLNDPKGTANPIYHVLPTENGQSAVKIDVLASFPLPSPVATQIAAMKASFDYFNKARSLVFGHRGMGMSYKNYLSVKPGSQPVVSPYVENTVKSFNAAGQNGGDGVEFDVVITRDLVPIIYHDFFVVIKAESPTDGTRFVKIPIHDLNYDEIRSLKLYRAAVPMVMDKYPHLSTELFRIPNDIAFPKLEEMLQMTDPKLAFDLEVKYPQMSILGQHECPGYHDRNLVADLILSVLAEHAGNRHILFSSFDFDSCLVLASKQNIWPVAALTQGNVSKWPDFLDPRTRSTASTAQFAKSNNIWGISAHAMELLADPSMLSYVRKTVGVGMMVWGDDVEDAKKAALLMPKNSDEAANIIITDNTPGVVSECH